MRLLFILATLLSVVPVKSSKIYHKDWIDFNKNGVKDVYEDPKADIDARINDLLSQMTIEEKTCQMVTLYGYRRVLKDQLPTPQWKEKIWKDGVGAIDEHLNSFIGWSVNFGDKSTYPIIEVSTTASGVYVGGCVGKVHTSNTAANVGYSSNLSGIKVYGKITASDGVAAGIIAGCVNVHGDTAEPKMNLGTSGGERPSIHTTTEINGAKVGSLTENVSDFAKSISTYFGLLSKGA